MLAAKPMATPCHSETGSAHSETGPVHLETMLQMLLLLLLKMLNSKITFGPQPHRISSRGTERHARAKPMATLEKSLMKEKEHSVLHLIEIL